MKKHRVVSASDFKARCLRLIDQVAEEGGVYVITKHGKALARLVPIEEGPSVRGSVDFPDSQDDLLSTGVAWDADGATDST